MPSTEGCSPHRAECATARTGLGETLCSPCSALVRAGGFSSYVALSTARIIESPRPVMLERRAARLGRTAAVRNREPRG
jgi:hypothetical protein